MNDAIIFLFLSFICFVIIILRYTVLHIYIEEEYLKKFEFFFQRLLGGIFLFLAISMYLFFLK